MAATEPVAQRLCLREVLPRQECRKAGHLDALQSPHARRDLVLTLSDPAPGVHPAIAR